MRNSAPPSKLQVELSPPAVAGIVVAVLVVLAIGFYLWQRPAGGSRPPETGMVSGHKALPTAAGGPAGAGAPGAAGGQSAQ